MRKIVRASLPIGIGIACDLFAGSGSTLVTGEVLGYGVIDTDYDSERSRMAKNAMPKLKKLKV